MLTPDEIREVQQRWTETQSQNAIQLLNGKSSVALEFTPAGFADLRGVVIEDFIKDRHLANLDLSACILKGFGQFGFCRIENCLFCHAKLGTNLGRQFSKCQFQNADVRNAILRGMFEDCNFGSARLVGTSGSEVVFRRCNFRGVNFKKAHLLRCTFEECVFEECVFGGGSLGRAKFVRTDHTTIDFADTILEGVSFG